MLAMLSAFEMLIVVALGFLVAAVAVGFAIYGLTRRAARDARRPPER